MGAWSHEPFGNDTACDWAYELDDATDLSIIESAIDAVLDEELDYIDASDAEEAIAAIEVIAKLLGQGTQTDSYTERADEWVQQVKLLPHPELIQKAKTAIEVILSEKSELVELWGDNEDWQISMAQLMAAIH
jgi:hypothetical protein